MKRDNEMSVADVLEKDQERQIQGVDIGDDAGQSLNDFISEREEDQELQERENVVKEAKANEG